ncbi:4-dihydrotrisporin dehydrogenase [Circinella umbellata]|nr:4-dihydrotrisporin dehydrogenase [Circinella umbellata]
MAPLIYVVTGTSQGIGLEYVKQLAERGDIVIGCARNPDASEPLKALVDNNKNVFSVTMDITNLDSIKTAAEKIQILAPEGIDVLINNAGSPGAYAADSLVTKEDDYRQAFNTNVIGTSSVIQVLLPWLRKRTTRHIINIGSIMGSLENTTTGIGASYRVSKAAENMLTKLLASQLAKESFIVLVLHPGWVKTRLGTDHAPVTVEQSASGGLSVIDNLTKEENGKFISFEGKELPW